MYNKAKQAIQLTLLHEGGYVNHPDDPGGETNFGISKRAYPEVNIKRLTVEDAIEIYYRDYWTKIRADKLPTAIAIVVFDTAVNSGITRAIKWLQKIVGVRADGIVGPVTLAAVQRWYDKDKAGAVNEYMDTRLSFLRRLRHWNTFGRGWSNRIASVRNAALKHTSRE